MMYFLHSSIPPPPPRGIIGTNDDECHSKCGMQKGKAKQKAKAFDEPSDLIVNLWQENYTKLSIINYFHLRIDEA